MSDITADDPQLLASIRLGEGLRLRAYPDPESPLVKTGKGSGAPWSIGDGHTGPDVGPSTVFTADQAESHLRTDVANAMQALDAEEPWWRDLTENRQRAIAELVFNVGLGGFQSFHKVIFDLEAGRYADAANELRNSLWYKQVGSRAVRLCNAVENG